MPSTVSSSNSSAFDSSTVMTPSLPTFCIASAILSPIMVSPFAAIVPTWEISAEVLIFLERRFKSATASLTAMSMPRLRSIGFMPAATALAPSFTMEWARTSIPRNIRSRSSVVKLTSLAAMVQILANHSWNEGALGSGGLADRHFTFDDAHDVRLLHDQELLRLDLDLAPGPFAEQDVIA